MFDLIDECGRDLKRYGYTLREVGEFGITEAYLNVKDKEESDETGLAQGEYFIVSCPFFSEFGQDCLVTMTNILKNKLRRCLRNFNYKREDRLLIVGLGNPDIAADRLGKNVFDEIDINPMHKKNNIFKFCPNIFFYTGIDTLEIVKMLAQKLKIHLIIIIDSLTTSSLARLGSSFQITTSGMTPGSGVNRFGNRICRETVGVNCISIGVPFMIFASSIKEDEREIILTSKDVKEDVENASFIISRAIKEAIK